MKFRTVKKTHALDLPGQTLPPPHHSMVRTHATSTDKKLNWHSRLYHAVYFDCLFQTANQVPIMIIAENSTTYLFG